MIPKLCQRLLQPKEYFLRGERYRFIDNGADVLAVAHVDFVEAGPPLKVLNDGCIVSSRLDDRAGVHAILDLLPRMGVSVDVLLCDDEEMGQSTAALWLPEKNYRYAVEFDRRGFDAVLYNDFPTLEYYLQEYWRIGWGSYSDVAHTGRMGIPSFNCGIGYFDEHSKECHALYSDLRYCVEVYAEFHEQFKDADFFDGVSQGSEYDDPDEEYLDYYGIGHFPRRADNLLGGDYAIDR